MEFKRGTQVHKGALIVFPNRTTEYGSIWELANGIYYAEVDGIQYTIDLELTKSMVTGAWYVLEDEGSKPVLQKLEPK